MPKLTFSSVVRSFVSLLLVFAVVAVGLLAVGNRATNLAQAQINADVSLDSGISCSTDAQCATAEGAGAGTVCINGSCGIPVQGGKLTKAQRNSLKEFSKAVNQVQTGGLPNVQNTAGNDILPAVANGFTLGLIGNGEDESLQANSVLGTMTSGIVYMFDAQPASSYIAVTDFLNNAGVPVAPLAYAQNLGGLGFASLDPILSAWKTFRNIAYLFFVVIILAIGFMIMFRQKMGQSAVTAQQAIPRVIIALITVTFSYAIAGLLIDAMYLVMALLVGVFGFANNQEAVLLSTPFSFLKLVHGGASTASSAVQSAVDNFFHGNAIAVDQIAGWTVGLIVAIAIVFSVFSLFFELLKTYITIIISITLAPLLLMLGAIPGKDVFSGWLKGLIGNLAAFPTVLLILLIYDQLTGGLSGNGEIIAKGGGFSPPYLFGTVDAGGIAYFFIGVGLLIIMTPLVKEAKKAMGATGGVFEQFGTAFGDAFKKGYSGGELVQGLGFTDTRKWGKDTFGGVTAENLIRKAGVVGAAVPGMAAGGLAAGTVGAATGAWDNRYQLLSRPDRILTGAAKGVIGGFVGGAARGGLTTAQYASDQFNEEQLFAKNKKDRKEKKKGYGDV